jgi:hypothetical protein
MIFPMIFGCLHALLISDLLTQTILLTSFEIAYLLLRIISFYKKKASKKMKISLAFMSSALRIIFINTFYLYNSK